MNIWVLAWSRIFQLLFTYYRLSRMFLLCTLNFIHRNLTIGQKQQTVSKVEICNWSMDFPEHIKHLILQRLHVSDYFRCRALSHSWRATVDMAITSKFSRPVPQLPWLMLCSHPLSLEENCFLSLSDSQKFICKSFPACDMNRRDCVGSIEGWLIMVDCALWRPEGFMKPWSLYLELLGFPIYYFFLNPISGAKVMLPSSPSKLPCNCYNFPFFFIKKIVASSVPTSQHCFVASLCLKGHLAFCRPDDLSWTVIDQGVARNLIFEDAEILNGKLYASTTDAFNFLMVFAIDIQYANGIPSYTTEMLVRIPVRVLNTSRIVTINNGVRFETNGEDISLAKDSTSQELFLIIRRHNFVVKEFEDRLFDLFPWRAILGGEFIIPPQVQGFRVFKLEWNLNGPRWVEVFNLGDQILFVSAAGSKFISTSNVLDCNGSNEAALERNCIYFAFDNPCFALRLMGLDVGVFSLTDKSIRCLSFPRDHSKTKLYSRPVWFTPNFW